MICSPDFSSGKFLLHFAAFWRKRVEQIFARLYRGYQECIAQAAVSQIPKG
jgi:hypothetical protein